MIKMLSETSLFKGISLKQLSDIAEFCDRLVLNEGDMLIQEDEAGNSDIYVLIEGNVEVVSNNTNLTSGEVVLSHEDKELFGEIGWLTNAKRTASVRCYDGAEVIRIDGEKLMQYLEETPEVGFIITRRIAQTLSQRMEESDRLLKQILWNKNI
ncbi:MAG: cyclic nucleotide-binding domain-containing protein [Gammaproteobacteria bacterium]|nr:cyclic nucleotide-binding domain-containing protein [Gammaproteobacteria bacterium]